MGKGEIEFVYRIIRAECHTVVFWVFTHQKGFVFFSKVFIELMAEHLRIHFKGVFYGIYRAH